MEQGLQALVVVHVSDELVLCTVRVEAHASGKRSTGTGFWFEFAERDGMHIPAIITNRHVVEGFDEVHFALSPATPSGDRMENALLWGKVPIKHPMVVYHPNPAIDLAAILPGGEIHRLTAAGTSPHLRRIGPDLIIPEEEAKNLLTLEDVVMIGYPNGIWDKTNNLPVVRRGLTASPVSKDWNGKPEFLIDAACFPGSSGSPVFLYNQGTYATRGATKVGTRVKLLGILYAGPQFTIEGKLEVRAVPTLDSAVAVSRIPTNLGICIKAREILGFNPIMEGFMDDQAKARAV